MRRMGCNMKSIMPAMLIATSVILGYYCTGSAHADSYPGVYRELGIDLPEDRCISFRRATISFSSRQSAITEDYSRDLLGRIARQWRQDGGHVLIEGYMDIDESRVRSESVSERRALNVRRYLMEIGVPMRQIIIADRRLIGIVVENSEANGGREPTNRAAVVTLLGGEDRCEALRAMLLTRWFLRNCVPESTGQNVRRCNLARGVMPELRQLQP